MFHFSLIKKELELEILHNFLDHRKKKKEYEILLTCDP